MASIKDRLMGGLRGFLQPSFQAAESGEAAALGQMYDNSNAENVTRGAWYGLHGPTGLRTAVLWVCACGQSYKLLEAEKFRAYTCGVCKRPFDFAGWTGLRISKSKQERSQQLNRLAGVGISEADYLPGQDGDWLKPDRHEFLLRHVLRVRPNGVEARTGPRLISTWDDDAGDVEYAQHNPGAGVGFGNPR